MSYDFDIDYMNECMEPFAFSCPENDEYINKFEEICQVYHQTVDNLVDEIISVMQNDGKTVVNAQIIENLEKKLEKQAIKKAETPKSAKKLSRRPLGDRTISTIGQKFTEESEKDDESMETSENSVEIEAVTEKFRSFAPFQKTPWNFRFLKRKDAGNVVCKVEGKHFQQADLMSNVGKIEIISKLPEDHYGGDKASLIIEAKAKRLGQIANIYRNAYAEITDWGNALTPSAESIFTYGQILRDESKESEKFGENSVCLMIDDEDGSIIRLDLSNIIDDVTLFPGQIIVINGCNETGEELVVKQIFEPPALPLSKCENNVSADVWFAAGPFTSIDNCGYEQLCELLDKIVQHQPSLVILTGPFVDRRNTFMTTSEFTLTFEMLMEDLFTRIEEKLEGTKTELIIQLSSERDCCVVPVFPINSFRFLNKRKLSKKFHFVPDPCVLKVFNGAMEIGITSSEIITHLSKNEYHRSSNQENIDRLARLNNHLLNYRSMYPLEPAEISASMKDVIECGELKTAPHLMVVPCILAPFVKKINETIFVNPSSLGKGSSGTFVKSSINVKKSESIADTSLFEIVKI